MENKTYEKKEKIETRGMTRNFVSRMQLLVLIVFDDQRH